ncbi:glycoside hydrolase family 43 protein [Paenibacillus sp. HB172176]|uniref:glycoside hydrolase family 43 protein n=1 Tax=Paenibacillus sp. HB172176 TaxID=2493690 RepID=UPI00143B5055|nr:glycoside hydrolase family 43 protein [Paenibacillus sp. HB172176]
MKHLSDIQIRDPFVLPLESEGRYYLYGSTDANIWGKGTGFDAYVSSNLQQWEGPFTIFRPGEDFFSDTNFWAPEVYPYGNVFIMFATFRRKDNGLLGTAVLAANNPLGPFELHSDGPLTPESWSSLDGSLHIDGEGQPWMVFCHEWQQTGDGEVCAVRLSEDLKRAEGEPLLLFRASEAPWTTPFLSERFPGRSNYVTDGPYLVRGEDGALHMLWASFIDNKYALGLACSLTGRVEGPWEQEREPLYRSDGGHGMIFRTFGGEFLLAIHTPNRTPDERPIFLPVKQRDGRIMV